MPGEQRARALASSARALAQATDAETTATVVIEQGLRLLGQADAVAVTVRERRGRMATIAASDDLARHLSELQQELGEGPYVDGDTRSPFFRSGEVDRDDRWPGWGQEAARLGVGSMLSVRLAVEDSLLGTLNFYATRRAQFADPDDVEFALLYATHVAIALTARRQISSLETALRSRHVIGVAQGLLMERFGLDLDASFDLLGRYSSTSNQKLTTVAQEIVRNRKVARTIPPSDATSDPPS